MNTIVKSAAVTACAFLALGMAAPANAAPGDHGKGVGGCIDQLYGNATNSRLSGHGVLPSLSPGPWLLSGSFGPTLGSIIQVAGGNAGDLHDLEVCPFATSE